MSSIREYKERTPFTCAASGTARWCIAESPSGEEVFLKEFLSPNYPDDDVDLPEAIRWSRIKTCEMFERRKRKLYDALRAINTGNMIVIDHFFRHGSKYYIVTERVVQKPMSMAEISHFPMKKIAILIRSLVYCMVQLAKAGIVHGDIKPDNILLKETTDGFYTTKLIDFDSGFFENDPPDEAEDAHGDLVYLAPEMLLHMLERSTILSSKIDVFATGIIIHQMLTGVLPQFNTTKYAYVHEAVLNNDRINMSPSVPMQYHSILSRALLLDPKERPSFEEFFFAVIGEEDFAPKASPIEPRAVELTLKNPFLKPPEPW